MAAQVNLVVDTLMGMVVKGVKVRSQARSPLSVTVVGNLVILNLTAHIE